MSETTFSSLTDAALQFRKELEKKKFILLYAHNGTGKTRLSTAFKDLGKMEMACHVVAPADESLVAEMEEWPESEGKRGDTLYFNAFTEDLFTWDNDLDNDWDRT
jgi:hypothetical protein